MMSRRCWSPAVAALALLLLLSFSHRAAVARLLQASTAPHQDIVVINVKAADAASERLHALPTEGGNKVGNGEEAVWGVTTTADEEGEEAEAACEEGSAGEECMQRRLLHDAHLDYIYTQHKGRP